MASIDRAVTLLSALGQVEAVSAPVFSKPWGFESDSEFINVGVNLVTSLTPDELLAGLLEIERQISPSQTHRNADGSYSDRNVDLDLIACGDICSDTSALTLPHPRMHLRPFVLGPLTDLMPDWIHPRFGLNAAEMLARLQ